MIGLRYAIASKHYLTPSQEPLRAAITGEPYPVKASIMFGTNPLLTYVDTQNISEALNNLDLIVTVEFFKSATAMFSDLILPASGNHEYEDLSPRSGHINTRPKLVEPPGECKSDIQWINLMANELGVGDQFWSNEEEMFDFVLEPINKSYKQLVTEGTIWAPQSYYKHKADGFRTLSGKAEIYSETLNNLGISPLPRILPQNPISERYPLLLTTGKDYYSYHSSWRQLPSLRESSMEPFVELNPKTSKKYGLKEGNMVVIETERGRIIQNLRTNSDLDPRIVYAAFGWGSSDEWKENNLNILTDWDTPLCEAMGAATFRGIPCRIEYTSA
jgi:anaerobic selenocysteine-containing dehydrogenase